uniref:Retinal cone rhodopsin-sensitive cGMP 3',5'-cyclic phosphodiesterase subunit gamma n=1 Tax=Salmo trutta TaxID=8032 RepID=A0A674BZ08_SALTR
MPEHRGQGWPRSSSFSLLLVHDLDDQQASAEMNTAPPAGSALATPAGTAGPTTPKKGPPKFKQRQTRTFKSKAPKPGQKGFGDDIPGMEGLGTDIAVVCPWEAYGDMELSDLAKYGII